MAQVGRTGVATSDGTVDTSKRSGKWTATFGEKPITLRVTVTGKERKGENLEGASISRDSHY